MVGDETDNARARRSRAVLESLEGVTLDDFAAAVWDSRLIAADGIVPRLSEEWRRIRARELAAPGGLSAADPEWGDAVRAIDRLERWDRVADTASVETTWFVLMVEAHARADRARRDTPGDPGPASPRAGPEWTRALLATLDALKERWGTVEVPWGRLNRHQRPLPGGPVDLDPSRPSLAVGAASGGLGSVFSYYSRPVEGPVGPRIGTGGNSFVKVVEFGPEPRARSILNYGQSGDPASPHFFDQATRYVKRRFKPAWYGREEVQANAVRSYVVGGG
jgi:acyl-homoserine lactone acylase PvdQ